MSDSYSIGMCLVTILLMRHLQDQIRNRMQPLECGKRLTTVDDTASPMKPAEASTWDANEWVIYLMIMTQPVLSQIFLNGCMSLIWQGMPPDTPQFTEAMLVNTLCMNDNIYMHIRVHP